MRAVAACVVLGLLVTLATAQTTSGASEEVVKKTAEPKKETVESTKVAVATKVDAANSTKSFPKPIMGDGFTQVFLVIVPLAGLIFAAHWNKEAQKVIIHETDYNVRNDFLTPEIMKQLTNIAAKVSDGATTFLVAEYRYMAVFVTVFGGLLYVMLGMSMANAEAGVTAVAAPWANAFLSLVAFLVGAATSIVSGWLGMRIAVFCNSRTAVLATEGAAEGDVSKGFSAAFQMAFRGGLCMGFTLTSMGCLALFIMVKVAQMYFPETSQVEELYECVAAFGLGGSAIACFGRVGGGIFTKAADVGSDLVGKLEKNIPEDDARNPGVIADCIGDNVGDIAGMGSDLFGSFGEACCAALVISSSSPELHGSFTAMMYPLLVTVSGIIVCIATSMLAANDTLVVTNGEEIEPILKKQLVVSTVIATVVLAILTDVALPDEFTIGGNASTKWSAYICVLAGLWSGLFIGYTTEYYTSKAYRPVLEIAESCETGAATNIIYGLALGYLSVLPPVCAMCVTIFISYKMCSLYGYALAALGILSTMATALTIDAYGPISDNAGGMAEMSHMGPEIRAITDALDAAGNTTAAIGKGFAISSAAFVGLALYGAFVTRVGLKGVNILDERVMPGLLFGAMLPFWFSAMTMKSVGIAAMDMVNEIRRQFQDPAIADGTKEPDYEACVRIATQAALHQMVAPAALVILTPIICGVLFGKYTLAGLLPGAIVSGVQMAISSSNTGGAWDNCKKYIEAGALGGKGSACHTAAVIGDTVGDPLKDTSGPALNILIKLMAIISLVFAPVVQSQMGGIIMKAME
jgi:inorganic pyrophosphatase